MVRRAIAGPSSQINDFIRFSRHLLFEGRNVYVEYEPTYTITKYPPAFAFLFAPLVPLPMWAAASLWFWGNLALSIGAAVVGALVIMDDSADGRAPGRTARRERRRRVILPYVLTAPVIISNLETGQVNIVIVFLLVVVLFLQRQERDLLAGGILGGIIALKLTPALFVLYFAWKGAWRLLAGTAVGLLVCWGFLPLLAYGPGFYADVMEGWLRTVAPFLAEGTIAEGLGGFLHTNQSLSAAVIRYLTETPAGGGREDFTVNVATVGLDEARWIVRGLSAAIVAFLAWVCARGGRREAGVDGRSFAARFPLSYGLECALVMIAILFLSPISWINHYVYLLFPYGAAVAWLASRPESAAGWRFVRAAVWVSFGLLLTSVSVFLQALSLPFFGAVVLAVGLTVALRSEAETAG
ncbi:hypothetical protein BH18GEM1_BH18GEM1_13820 [soil metagenome]